MVASCRRCSSCCPHGGAAALSAAPRCCCVRWPPHVACSKFCAYWTSDSASPALPAPSYASFSKRASHRAAMRCSYQQPCDPCCERPLEAAAKLYLRMVEAWLDCALKHRLRLAYARRPPTLSPIPSLTVSTSTGASLAIMKANGSDLGLYRGLLFAVRPAMCGSFVSDHASRDAIARRALQPSLLRCPGHSVAGTGAVLCVSLSPN